VQRFLIGTAGHIDHGKTALVKALTGIDTDRLPEEKKRGITIDLGYAHAEWDEVRLSFVDVPGHERFVRNMLAGAGGIDAVLLVVAADESVMPQTREHFEIVRMLGIRRGVVAITKIDRVAPELIGVTLSDVADLTRGSFLEGAPALPVSARTGEGIPALKRALVALAGPEEAASRERRAARLPVDRAFSVAGFGPVVTGSLVSGTISKDQKLELLPSGRLARVRRIEVHGREVAEARAGERVSANLAGVELAELSRGVVLAAPASYPVTSRLTVRLELLAGSPPVKSGDRVSFHHYSAQRRARVRVLDGTSAAPGTSARAQLRLSAPVPAAPGDRFVIRRLSPVETIGGGVVLDPLPPTLSSRLGAEDRAALERLEGPVSEKLVGWIEASREKGADEAALAARSGLDGEALRAALGPALAAGRIHALRRSPDRYMAETVLARLAARAAAEIGSHLDSGVGALGLSRSTLLSRLLPGSDAAWSDAVERALIARGAYVVVADEARLRGREDLAGADRDLSERITDIYRARGLEPPSVGEVADALRHRPKVIEGLVGYLVKKGPIVRLPGGWLIARDAVDQVVRRLRESRRSTIGVGEFKEMFGLTRKLAIPLLEHLDSTRVTRRVGEVREILPG
jgi:selenocysteine-specific elongation factor